MKYYIPTPSLNLENILQAESISPASFYSARLAGRRSLETLPGLRGVNATVLFDRPVSFSTDSSSRYNFPMLIEIDDPTQTDGNGLMKQLGDGAYAFTGTLRLTPANCRFLFFNKTDCEITIAGARDNKAIKYFGDYSITAAPKSLRTIPLPAVGNASLPLAVNDESVTDKIKGAAYAFLLGQHLKSSPELARFKRLSQELYDLISGITVNFEFADRFKDRLSLLLKEFKATDPTEKANRKAFDSRLSADAAGFGIDKRQLIALNEHWGTWGILYSALAQQWHFDLLPLVSGLSSPDDYRRLRDEIERRTAMTVAAFRDASAAPRLSGFTSADGRATLAGMPVVTAVANFIVSRSLTPDAFMAERQALTAEIETIVRETFVGRHSPEEWDTAYAPYFKSLHAHIANLTQPFDFGAAADPEIRSVAAFLLRFNNIGDLIAFILAKEIHDPTGTLTLWGALGGYMALSRDVLAPVLTSGSYAMVYNAVFATEIYRRPATPPKSAAPRTRKRAKNKKSCESSLPLDFATTATGDENTGIAWIDRALTLIDDPKSRHQFKNDMLWFAGHHKAAASHADFISNLERYLASKLHARQKWVVATYSSIPIAEILRQISENPG